MKLYRLADKFEQKYLYKKAINANNLKDNIANHIKQAILNASTFSQNGIMQFSKMLEQDNATLSFNIIRDGSNITIDNFTINPFNLNTKYLPLMGQIKKYLDANLDLFPSKSNGESVEYDNFSFNIQYGNLTTV